MALPASGPLSINNINVELGKAGTTQSSLGQTDFRTLSGVASGTLSMSNFYGKANFPKLNHFIPNMTSNNAPSPFVALGVYSTTYYLYNGFNSNSAQWAVNNTSSAWLGINLGSSQVFNTVHFYASGGGSRVPEYPKNWSVQGSHNGSSWTTIKSFTNTSLAQNTVLYRTDYFFANTTAYRYYRIYVTAVNGAGWTALGWLNFSYV